LCEHRAEFAFAGASRLAWGSTGPAFGFGLRHEHLRSIHLNVQVRNRWTRNDRKMKLPGALDNFLLPDLNIFTNRFGGSLYRFSGNYSGPMNSDQAIS
jgi:hypothetical protein